MLSSIFVQLSVVILTVTVFLFAYRIVRFVMIVFFGENINVTYIDENGDTIKKRVNVKRDDELMKLIDEMNKSDTDSGFIAK